MCRLMLQLDPRIRPCVEVLERLPSLQPFIVAAKAIVTEFKQQEVNMMVLLYYNYFHYEYKNNDRCLSTNGKN